MRLILLPFLLGALLPQGDRQEILSLFERLKADEIEVRESAREKLLKKGVRAVEVLLSRPAPADAEAATRLDGVFAEIVESCVRADWKERMAAPVTLDLKDAPVLDAIEGLRKQSRLKIGYDDRNVPDDLRIDQVKLTSVPFARALEAICGKAELAIVRAGLEEIKIGRPPRVTFTFRKVDAEVIFDMTFRVTGMTVQRDPEVKGRLDCVVENVAWSSLMDELAARSGWVALQKSDTEIRVRRRADFEAEVKAKSFPLTHLRLEDPVQGRRSPFATLFRTIESRLSRGASWGTVHGKVSFDPRRRAIVVTDLLSVIAEAEKIVAELDREPR